MGEQDNTGKPPGGHPQDKSAELLDSLNTLSFSIQSFSGKLEEFVEVLEAVLQHFSVIISTEAEKRSMTVEELIGRSLMNVFKEPKP